MIPDLDRLISDRERELADLYQRRRERDQAALLLAILKITDDWFTANELSSLAALEPVLDDKEENGFSSLAALRRLQGKSPKALGKLLTAIANDQERAAEIPTLRLLRTAHTNGGRLWKIETH